MMRSGDAVGTRLADLLVPSEPENVEFLRAFIRSGYNLLEAETYEKDLQGNMRWFSNSASGVLEDGRLIRVWSVRRDVTERKRAEQALHESEDRFRSLFENATVGIYRTTPGGHILMANPTLIRMLGYESLEELASRSLEAEGFEPTYPRSEFRERIEREGEVMGLEAAWKRRDGSVIFVRESAKAIREELGRVLHYDGIVEDITARKRAEEALRESVGRLRQALEAGEFGTWELEVKSGRIWRSPRHDQIFGYETLLPEWTFSMFLDHVLPEDREEVEKHLAHVLATATEWDHECRIRRADGAVKWIWAPKNRD